MERFFALGLTETVGAVWDPQYLKPLFSRTLRIWRSIAKFFGHERRRHIKESAYNAQHPAILVYQQTTL